GRNWQRPGTSSPSNTVRTGPAAAQHCRRRVAYRGPEPRAVRRWRSTRPTKEAEMTDVPAYEVLAQAFIAEGVKANFALMGDANMHWVNKMSEHGGMLTMHARHEHCVCGMAMGYAMTTGEVGIASVTLGPGVSQIMTALTWASKASVPLIVFAGEMPV